MRVLELLRIDTIPELAFKKPAGHHLLFPELVRREPIFSHKCASATDHRSVRSRCRLLRSSSIFITGLHAGGLRPTEIGGVILKIE
jgi:hypothetical protein